MQQHQELPKGWHFTCRHDLAIELCADETLADLWPRGQWTASELFDYSGLLQTDRERWNDTRGPAPTVATSSRLILARATPPGKSEPEPILMFPSGWSVPVEPALPNTLFDRAFSFLIGKGISPHAAQFWLEGDSGMNRQPLRRLAPCGLAIERSYATALCLVISLLSPSASNFLAGVDPIFIPDFPDEEETP